MNKADYENPDGHIFYCDKTDWYVVGAFGNKDWSKSEKQVEKFWKDVSEEKMMLLDYDFSDFVFPALIKNTTDFNNSLRKVLDVELNRLDINGKFNCSRAYFLDEIKFSEIHFQGLVIFDEVKFSGPTVFTDIVCKGDMSFEAAVFEKEVRFNHVDSRVLSFNSSKFNSNTWFTDMEFSKLEFRRSKFEKIISFNGVRFFSSIFFGSCVFNEFWLKNSSFYRASFVSCRFGNIKFQQVEFEDYFVIKDSQLLGKSSFQNIDITGEEILFINSVFSSEPLFTNIKSINSFSYYYIGKNDELLTGEVEGADSDLDLKVRDKQLEEKSKKLDSEKQKVESRIEKLVKSEGNEELIEKLQLEKGELEQENKRINEKKEQVEKKLEQERLAKEITNEEINNAIEKINQPNKYLNNLIISQWFLIATFMVVILALVIYLIFYYSYYHDALVKSFDTSSNPGVVKYLFYISPFLLGVTATFSLVSQINNRINKLLELNEHTRYINSIKSGLEAYQEVSNDADTREYVKEVMRDLVRRTIEKDVKIVPAKDEQIDSESALKLIESLKKFVK
ncbi:MAG: hypothetical protein AAFQ94_12150 [Bacteroidota bacterium]